MNPPKRAILASSEHVVRPPHGLVQPCLRSPRRWCVIARKNQAYAGEVSSELDSELRKSRGDANSDGELNLAEPVALLNALFSGGGDFTCADAADADDDGSINLTDTVRILLFLFSGEPEIPAPGAEECGPDPQAPGLGCAVSTSC